MFEKATPNEKIPDSMKYTRKTSYFSLNGLNESRRKLLEETFDSEGRLITKTKYLTEASVTTITYSYDSDNHLNKQVETGPDGSKTKEFENIYDSQGRIVEVREKGSSLSRQISYLDDGQRMDELLLGGSLQKRIVYDSNHNALQEYSPGANIGIVRSFDEFGNPIEERTEFSESHDVKRFENQYDAKGHLLQVKVDGRLHLQQTFDSYGRLIERKEYDFGSQLMGVWEYIYEKFKP
jgi:YD repeat-containing protein